MGILPKLRGDSGGGEAVQGTLADLLPTELVLTGESDDGSVPAFPLLQVVPDGVEVLDRARDSVGDHHRPGFPADLALPQHLIVEVVDHDFRLQADRVITAFDEPPQLLLGLFDIELRVVLHRLGQLVVALHGGVMGEHVQDEPLLNRLLHGVTVEGEVLDRAVGLRSSVAEDLQGLVLGGGREGEVAGVGKQPARLHQAVDLVLEGLLFLLFAGLGEGLRHGRAGAAALARMGLIDDDGKGAAPMVAADLAEDEGELLHGRDDDLLARLDEPAQIPRAIGVSHRRPHLGVLPDRVADLPVEEDPVGHHDDGVEDRAAVPGQSDQLMGQPGAALKLSKASRYPERVSKLSRYSLASSTKAFRDSRSTTSRAVTFASFWATAGFTAKKRLASPRMIAAVRRFMRVSAAAMPTAAMPTARPCGALMAFSPDPG